MCPWASLLLPLTHPPVFLALLIASFFASLRAFFFAFSRTFAASPGQSHHVRQDRVQVFFTERLAQDTRTHVAYELRIVIDLGGHEHDPLDDVRVFNLHPPVERRPVHHLHVKVREDQIVDVGSDSFERGMSIGDRIDLAVSLMSYRTGHRIAKERIIVNNKDARTLEASRMDVTVRATAAWLASRKSLTADRAMGVLGRHWSGLGATSARCPLRRAESPGSWNLGSDHFTTGRKEGQVSWLENHRRVASYPTSRMA